MESTLIRLRKNIGQLRKQSICNRSFVNPHELRALFTKDTIEKSVKECHLRGSDLPGILSKIYEHGITVFAILIWMKEEDAIIKFIEHDTMDAGLPIEEARAKEVVPDFGEHFYNVQWEFLPRVFEKSMRDKHGKIRKEVILPFIREVPLGQGGYSDVFLMSVAPSQQLFFPNQTPDIFVVRKRLKARPSYKEGGEAEDAFRRELECLKLLNRLQHPNIIELLGSYTYKDQHNLLFPHLDMDLKTFLKRDERFGEFKWNFTFYSALQGLSSALSSLHDLRLNIQDHGIELTRTYTHYDIRSPNILVNHKTFILADFGFAGVQPEEESSRTIQPNGCGENTAPEFMLEGFGHKNIGLPVDIWAFGCIIAEVATYIERGSKGVAEFYSRRKVTTFTSQPSWQDEFLFRGNDLKPEVASWFLELSADPRDKQLHELLGTMMPMLRNDPEDRPEALEIYKKMTFLSITSLFFAVQEAFAEYLQSAKQQDDRPPLANIWLEKERLKAWGVVLGITGKHHMPARFEEFDYSGTRSRDILFRLFQHLELHITPSNLKVSRPVAECEPILTSPPKPTYEVLRGLVQELWDLLPLEYQQKVQLVWLEGFPKVNDAYPQKDIGGYLLSAEMPLCPEVSAVNAMATLGPRYVCDN